MTTLTTRIISPGLIMLHPNSFTSSLGSEVFALRAVLRTTINATQSIDWETLPSTTHSAANQPDQLQELSQHLQYLQSVGLKLSARWHSRADLCQEQTEVINLLSPQLLNLLRTLANTMEMLEQHGVQSAQVSSCDQFKQAGEDFARLLKETTEPEF